MLNWLKTMDVGMEGEAGVRGEGRQGNWGALDVCGVMKLYRTTHVQWFVIVCMDERFLKEVE